MKIKIIFLLPHNNKWIGGWDRKYDIYFKNLSNEYFEKYFVEVTNIDTEVDVQGERVVLTASMIKDFLFEREIQYIYFAWAKIDKSLQNELTKKYIGLLNINFTPRYDNSWEFINLIISKTDYRKLARMHGSLINSYVVYNPIDVTNWCRLSSEVDGIYRNNFHDKKAIIGRLWRAEPSKWHFLMIATLVLLQRRKNYSYGFIFAWMPYLYRKVLKVLLHKKMYTSILFLPELKRLDDIAKFYKSIDIFWQTSRIGESFWNVIAEAFCFKVPVITDFKRFYRNGKVIEHIYDAQIELVDHEINWWYCKYPSKVIDFLEQHTLDDIQVLWYHWYEKVHQLYDVKDTAITLAKILYKIGKEKWFYTIDPCFEQLQQNPTTEELEQYQEVYFEKIALCQQTNTLHRMNYYCYMLLNNLWRWVEYLYLLVRKLAKKYGKKDIESY